MCLYNQFVLFVGTVTVEFVAVAIVVIIVVDDLVGVDEGLNQTRLKKILDNAFQN